MKNKLVEFTKSRKDYEVAAFLSFLCFLYGILDHNWTTLFVVYGIGMGIDSHFLYIWGGEDE